MKNEIMKTYSSLVLAGLMLPMAALNGRAQGFNSGSTGADGALNITANTTIPLPTNGVLNYTTITVPQGFTVRFTRNALNTPVYLLATGDVVINGVIDVSGANGNNIRGGDGGPGGFDGGNPGISGQPPGAGYGPGAGKGGTHTPNPDGAGGGGYGSQGTSGNSTNRGAIYGSPLLLPLLGGSGGGGTPTAGGAGGGGAILIASNTRIDIGASATVRANGGTSGYGYGSGGGIRLVAPLVSSSRGTLQATGSGYGGNGRIRVDTINRRSFELNSNPPLFLGSFMTVFPPVVPRLDIIEAAGTQIPEGTGSLVTVQLPFGADPNRTIVVRARDFAADVPIEVSLTPDSGSPVTYTATINNSANNPGQVAVPVVVPANTVVTVHAWTR
jgi:hypothetical protein